MPHKLNTMRNKYSALILSAIVLFTSCSKEEAKPLPPPLDPLEMDYTSLHEKEIKYAQPAAIIDLDGDNQTDLVFGVLLVGDPLEQQDKRQFRLSSGIHTNLAVNNNEQVPAMVKDEVIPLSNFNGYNWYKVSSVILVQRIENIDGIISWNGNWQGATKKYLPFQQMKNNQRFNGWIELSVDVFNEKLILHRMAISKLPETVIKAG